MFPEAMVPPAFGIQTLLMEKQPVVISIPLEKDEDAPPVWIIDPPVIVTPFEDASPLVVSPAAKVEEAPPRPAPIESCWAPRRPATLNWAYGDVLPTPTLPLLSTIKAEVVAEAVEVETLNMGIEELVAVEVAETERMPQGVVLAIPMTPVDSI